MAVASYPLRWVAVARCSERVRAGPSSVGQRRFSQSRRRAGVQIAESSQPGT